MFISKKTALLMAENAELKQELAQAKDTCFLQRKQLEALAQTEKKPTEKDKMLVLQFENLFAYSGSKQNKKDSEEEGF